MNKSLMSFLTALLFISAFCGLANPVAAQEATSQPDVKAICDEIAKSCPTTLLKGANEQPSGVEKLKSVVYDETVVKVLEDQLRVGRPDPVRLYIANLLVAPLLQAKPEVIKKALPAVEAAWKSMCGEYREFKKYSLAELAPLQQNLSLAPGPALLTKMEQISKAQDIKADGDRLVVLHNQQSWQLESVYFRMCMIAGDAARDKTVMDFVLAKERQKIGSDTPAIGKAPAAKAPFNGQWLVATEAVKKEVKCLSKERAKYYYDEFKKIGMDRKWEAPAYIKWTEPTTSRSDNSTYVPAPIYLGSYFLDAVNLLVPVAADPVKAPAMQVPTKDDVDKHNNPPKPVKPTTPTPPKK
jgi:hypothetical protein